MKGCDGFDVLHGWYKSPGRVAWCVGDLEMAGRIDRLSSDVVWLFTPVIAAASFQGVTRVSLQEVKAGRLA